MNENSMRDALDELLRQVAAAREARALRRDRMHDSVRVPRRLRPHTARATFTPLRGTSASGRFAV